MRQQIALAVLIGTLGLAACEREQGPAKAAQALVAAKFDERPQFSQVDARTDSAGKPVVCGVVSGPISGKPVTTRFYVVEGEAVLEHQDSLYSGADPTVADAASDYMQITQAWFDVGWQLICTDQPPPLAGS